MQLDGNADEVKESAESVSEYDHPLNSKAFHVKVNIDDMKYFSGYVWGISPNHDKVTFARSRF